MFCWLIPCLNAEKVSEEKVGVLSSVNFGGTKVSIGRTFKIRFVLYYADCVK